MVVLIQQGSNRMIGGMGIAIGESDDLNNTIMNNQFRAALDEHDVSRMMILSGFNEFEPEEEELDIDYFDHMEELI